MTFRDLVRERFPGATDSEADAILWEHTGFPMFFDGDVITACRSQLTALATLGPIEDDDVISLNPLDLSMPHRPRPYPRRRVLSSSDTAP